jgi:hypothetical protein
VSFSHPHLHLHQARWSGFGRQTSTDLGLSNQSLLDLGLAAALCMQVRRMGSATAALTDVGFGA